MQPELPPEIETLRSVVRDFANREIRPQVAEIERDESIPRELVDRMGELGLFGAPFPSEWGGAGMGELAIAIVQEELSRAHRHGAAGRRLLGAGGSTLAVSEDNSPPV